jgi:Ca2+-binding RTX toxin-like protein
MNRAWMAHQHVYEEQVMATIYGKVHYDYYGLPRGDYIDASDGVTEGADLIIGTDYRDTIYGLGGNDVLKGGGGADKLYGGEGTDTADYSDSGAGVQVSLGIGGGSGGTAEGDKLYDIENVSGSSYDDILMGDGDKNALYGEGGNDVLKGGGGADKLYGGGGDDTLHSDGLGDFIDGGTGNDTVNFGDSQFGVWVNLESGYYNGGKYFQPVPQGTPQNIVNVENVNGSSTIDHITGSNTDNILNGNGGADHIFGGGGKDTIDGGNDGDFLDGGAGNDLLTGGAGNDTFIFDAYSNVPVNIGKDVVNDFTVGQDHIEFDNKIFTDFADVQAHMQQVGNDVVISYDGNNTVTLHNVNMNSLSASDFLFT